MTGPLQGVRVLDLSINVLGPLSCQILGDMGAEVIKVEAPGGDPQRSFGPTRSPGMSAFYMNLNRSKKSVVLDLKKPAAREALMKLIEGADVLVHSMRVRAAERLGIGYEAIAQRNPRIIYACGTGYSQRGPKRDAAAYDDVIQGESGIADMQLRANGKPGYIPMPFADKFCGYMQASSIAMALYARERTGRGQAVFTPMLETLVAFNLHEHLWGATYQPALTPPGYPRMFIDQRRPFNTKDGHLCLLAHTDDQWRRVFEVIERVDLASDPRFASIATRSTHVQELYTALSDALMTRTTAEWRSRLDQADVPNSAATTLSELLGSDYLWSTGFFRAVQHPSEGGIVSPATPTEFSDTPVVGHLPAPRLGQHGAEILGGLGYSEAEWRGMA
jgi:crotonobetainyl-CoA:carnitine CoA-transferase CaiB-like acyl-CoA transferase